ncbi:MAG: hypothetical protein Q9164_002134, partial [Protoblastenia rupestris]
MLKNHQIRELEGEFYDKHLDWFGLYIRDDNLCIPPSSIEEMSHQTRNSNPYHAPEQLSHMKIPEPLLQSASRLMDQRSIDAPHAWTADPSGHTGQYERSSAFHHGQGPFRLMYGLSIPDQAAPQTPWPVGGAMNGFDASSTISPLSPRTPGERSDIDVHIVHNASPWPSAPPSTGTYHSSQSTDFKMESSEPRGGIGNPPCETQAHPDELPGGLGSNESDFGYESLPFNHLGTGLVHSGQVFHRGYPGSNEGDAVNPRMLRVDSVVSQDEEDKAMTDAEGDEDGDYDEYHPSGSVSQTVAHHHTDRSTRPSTRQRPTNSAAFSKPLPHKNRITKTTRSNHTPNINTTQNIIPTTVTTTINPPNKCTHCPHVSSSPTTLAKHIFTKHTRPYTCLFSPYACTLNFGSKNEWTRHIRVQHLQLEHWVCDLDKCAGTHSFDRKDLFTQHVRRMHAAIVFGSEVEMMSQSGKAQLE